jgi:hypothetical protein
MMRAFRMRKIYTFECHDGCEKFYDFWNGFEKTEFCFRGSRVKTTSVFGKIEMFAENIGRLRNSSLFSALCLRPYRKDQ